MMGERSVLPIQAILNRSPPRPRPGTPNSPSGSELSSPGSDVNDALPPMDGPPAPKTKRSRDSSDLTYTKPQGPIKYPPFESLDNIAEQQMAPFNVYPFGQIGNYCAHIPYSSDKKDVFEKTGRESFHVFVYRFTDPNDRQTHDVMWDYLGGFVRISPFFKSRKHKKTGPAKMLDANHGLRDITFHMTGGNRTAQGYWVPYSCARAVCATFCYPIAGALIPIFGPSFPQDCVRPDSPRFGRMDISEDIIREAKHEVTAYRHSSLNLGARLGSVTSHPRRTHDRFNVLKQFAFQRRLPRPPQYYRGQGPWQPRGLYVSTHQPLAKVAWSSTPETEAFQEPPNPSPTWTPINNVQTAREGTFQNTHPYLSAIPQCTSHGSLLYPPPWHQRPVEEEEEEEEEEEVYGPTRRRLGVERVFKRRKVDYEETKPREEVIVLHDSEDEAMPAPMGTHEVVVTPLDTAAHQPDQIEPLAQPVEKAPETTRYSFQEQEAAFSLMKMRQGLPIELDFEYFPTKRRRASSF